MKKLISLSAVLFVAAMAFAQDTIPPPGKNFPDSAKMDTMPGAKNWSKDTSALSYANKWPDTSMNSHSNDSMHQGMDQSKSNPSTDSSQAKKTTADRVIMKDDQVMVVKNGDSTLLADSIKLESGAVVTKDGTVTYTSGKAAKLKNGQYVSLTAEPASQSDSSMTTAATATKTVDDDKVIMVGDKVFVIKSGDSTVLADSIKLKSGAVVKSDASVKFKDGTSTILKNGQYIALNPPAAPAAEKSKDTAAATTSSTTTSTTTTSSATTKTAVEDKVVMKDDQVMVIKNGDSTLLEDSIKLASGAVVKKDGSVKFKNGSTTKLKNGQFIGLNTAPAEGKKTKKVPAVKKKING